MLKDKITVIKLLSVHSKLTKKDWQLYSYGDLCAKVLNQGLSYHVHSINSKDEVREKMRRLMYAWKDAGAYDTEPLDVLEDVLDYIYGQ